MILNLDHEKIEFVPYIDHGKRLQVIISDDKGARSAGVIPYHDLCSLLDDLGKVKEFMESNYADIS